MEDRGYSFVAGLITTTVVVKVFPTTPPTDSLATPSQADVIYTDTQTPHPSQNDCNGLLSTRGARRHRGGKWQVTPKEDDIRTATTADRGMQQKKKTAPVRTK